MTGKTSSFLFKGSGIILIGSILNRVLGLGGQILLIRTLPPELFGVLILAFTVVSTLSSIIVLGLPEGITRFISSTSSSEERMSVLSNGGLIVVLSGLCTAGLVLVFSSQISNQMDNAQLKSLLNRFSLFVVFFPISQTLISVLRSYRLIKPIAVAKDILPKLTAICAFGLFYLVGRKYTGAIVYLLLPPVLTALFAAYYIRSSNVTIRFDEFDVRWQRIRELLGFSLPLAFSHVFIVGMMNIDTIMIGVFLRPTQVAWYKSIQPISSAIMIVLTSLVMVYLPVASEYYASGNREELENLFQLSTKWITLLTFPAVVLVGVLSKDIISVVYGTQYTPASTAFIILTVGIFGRVVVGPNGSTVEAIGITKVDTLAAICGAATNVVLNVVLIRMFGIDGAAVATAVSFIVYNVIELLAIYRAVGIHPFRFDTIKSLLPMVGLALLLWRFVTVTSNGIPMIIVIGIGLYGAQILFAVATGSIDAQDWRLAKELQDDLTG